MAKKNEVPARYVLVGIGGYGLYYGKTNASDEAILKRKAVRLSECRHVRYWYGKSGGITSLAAYGPCGPRVAENRIGAPVPSALISEVVNVYDCTEEAVRAFAAIEVV